MKKQLLFILLLISATATFSQQNNPSPSLTKQDYLKKSKSQKTAANIMLYGGGGFFLVGITLITIETDDFWIDLFGGDEKYNSTGEVFLLTGLASMAGSIPLFIISSKNKKKANNVSAFFKLENRSFIQQQTIAITGYPALSFKIKL